VPILVAAAALQPELDADVLVRPVDVRIAEVLAELVRCVGAGVLREGPACEQALLHTVIVGRDVGVASCVCEGREGRSSGLCAVLVVFGLVILNV